MPENSKSRNLRRAIIYIAWGQRYVNLAIKSARSAAFLGLPIVLVTDQVTVKYLADKHPFSTIRIIKIDDDDQIIKTRMWEFLPEDFDSFLFLDVDTRVLKDINLGFDKAERHGIAAAGASHYCLDQFWDFGAIMKEAGVPLCGQNQFNTGVIFFTRHPDVEEVFRLWAKLAYELTDKTGWKRVDQPFFTLAIEKLGFNPYTLSPGYNYRALAAEPISGDLRIWHSFHEPPDDINDYDKPWPRKRYIGGPRAPLREVHTSDIRKVGKIIAEPVVKNG